MTATDRQPAPVACTLPPADFKARAAWLRNMTNRALLRRQVHGRTARLIYSADAAGEIEELVRLESSCCAFLKFVIDRSEDGIALTISGPKDAGKDARLLFAHLVPE